MSEPPAVDAARNPSTGRAAVPLAWRGDGDPPSRFHRGAHPPYGIRWFGSTALLGHLRRVAASIVASQAVDTRDWMRPERPHELLAHAARVLRAPVADAATLVERLGRPLWIDFVSDTGDDRDVSAAVARLVFAEYAPADGGDATILPRGDILLFGGDTAYPVATGREILRRVVQPWNEVLQDVGTGGRRRVLLGIPGNHDWYDGLDGFARLFRRDAVVGMLAHWEADRAHPARKRPPGDRSRAALVRQLHLDELAGSVDLIRSAYQSLRAIVRGERCTGLRGSRCAATRPCRKPRTGRCRSPRASTSGAWTGSSGGSTSASARSSSNGGRRSPGLGWCSWLRTRPCPSGSQTRSGKGCSPPATSPSSRTACSI
jgi:hypothetical protein